MFNWRSHFLSFDFKIIITKNILKNVDKFKIGFSSITNINIETVKFIRVDNMPFRTAWALTMCPIGRGKTLKKDFFVVYHLIRLWFKGL